MPNSEQRAIYGTQVIMKSSRKTALPGCMSGSHEWQKYDYYREQGFHESLSYALQEGT
jgi:hypothetical protein